MLEATVCLALAMYFEARGEGPVGMIAVGQVVINRLEDPRFPKSICGVIKQGGALTLFGCQFSWYCDSLSDVPKDKAAWQMSVELAGAMVAGGIRDHRLSKATCYHASWVQKTPTWAYNKLPILQEKEHIFYAC